MSELGSDDAHVGQNLNLLQFLITRTEGAVSSEHARGGAPLLPPLDRIFTLLRTAAFPLLDPPKDAGTMMDMLRLTDGSLHCPICGEAYGLHIEVASVAGRREDGPISPALVDEECVVTYDVPVPEGEDVGEGRRHRIALEGWCEFGDHPFAIVFTQHKGETFVEVVPWSRP